MTTKEGSMLSCTFIHRSRLNVKSRSYNSKKVVLIIQKVGLIME